VLRKKKYEEYNKNLNLQRRVISKNNFTYRNHLPLLSGFRDKNVLDIGCGTGTISLFLATKNSLVFGIDISRRAIEAANKNAERLGLKNKVNFQVCDYPNERINGLFDLVLLNDVLEHIPSQAKALEVVMNLLKKNGTLFISVPLKEAPLYRLGLLRKFDKRVGHIRRYSIKEITGLVNNYGLRVEKVVLTEGILRNSLFTSEILNKAIRFVKWPLGDVITFLDNILVNLFGPSQLIMLVKK